MKNIKLSFVFLTCLFVMQQASIAQSQLQTKNPPQFASNRITQNNIRVTLVEAANITSLQGMQTTSLLFVVEHLDTKDQQRGASNIDFLDVNAERIAQKPPFDEELLKSGTVIHNYSDYKSPWQTKLPEPKDPKRAYIVHQWFRTPIPENSKFLAVKLSGEQFKFPLSGR